MGKGLISLQRSQQLQERGAREGHQAQETAEEGSSQPPDLRTEAPEF